MASALEFSEQQLHELEVMITRAVEKAFAKYPDFAIATPPPPTTTPPSAVVALSTPPPPAASPITVAAPTPPPPAPPAAVKSSPPPRSPISIATANTKRRCMTKSPLSALIIAKPPPPA